MKKTKSIYTDEDEMTIEEVYEEKHYDECEEKDVRRSIFGYGKDTTTFFCRNCDWVLVIKLIETK